MNINRFTEKWEKLDKYISNSSQILLGTHINPDGDGLGACLGMYYYLKSIDKNCKIINESGRPEKLSMLGPESEIEMYKASHDEWLDSVDLVILFDIGDYARLGAFGQDVIRREKTVSIDHHPMKDQGPIDLAVIDTSSPAAGYMVWKFFEYLDLNSVPLPLNISKALYISLVSDTGRFKYQSTNSETHKMASHLLESNFNVYDIHRPLYEEQDFIYLKLLSKVIDSLNVSNNFKVVFTIITPSMLNDIGADPSHVDGITEYIRNIENVEISFMIYQKDSSMIRINFRSSGIYNVDDIASSFGGGGHKFASGATIEGSSIKSIKDSIIDQINKKIPGEIDVDKE